MLEPVLAGLVRVKGWKQTQLETKQRKQPRIEDSKGQLLIVDAKSCSMLFYQPWGNERKSLDFSRIST